MSFSSAAPGYEIDMAQLVVSHDAVLRYIEAVEGSAPLVPEGPELVPPMALAAASFRLLIETVGMPEGTMHLAQQFRFLGPVLVGTHLRARARVGQKLARGAGTAVALEHSVLAEEGAVRLSGRAMLLLPSRPLNSAPVPLGESPDEGSGGSAGAHPAAPGPVTARLALSDGLAPVVRQITAEKISRYARASGDLNPVHLDASFARKTPFGGIVAHGMMLLAYIAEVMERAFGPGWREGGGMDVRLRAPARPGDVVESRGFLQETRAAQEGMVAHCLVDCINQRRETLAAGKAWARLT